MKNKVNHNIIAEDFKDRMDYDELMNCMRCGFCLPSCPTYGESEQSEAASPRGRIALMKAVVDGKKAPDEDFEKQLNLCLGCRACEPACPSGVKYGHLLEEARDILNKHKKHSLPVKVIRKSVFNGLFPYQNRMRTLNGMLWLYQRSGVQKVVRGSKVLHLMPGNMGRMEKILPEIPSPNEMKQRPKHVKPTGIVKKRVAFFSGCLMDTMFMKTNDATLYLLEKAGCEIVIPEEQNCCGALHAHSGEKEKARELAKRNILAFEKAEIDYIISNAGGCGALLIEYDHLLKDESAEWQERARHFASKVKDIATVLLEVGLPKMKLTEQIVTYQDSCHLRNVMNAGKAPRQLLKQIEGVEFTEMKESDRCCGSAGVYNIIQPDMSTQILDHKMVHAKATKATTIVTSNPGCLLQMKLGVEREGLSEVIRSVHIVDLLAEAVKYAELDNSKAID
ncbi:(Fe-S)-binding protein [Halalkalibacter krulwichiae]|uniref:Glycolate oxidase iron-sulfur subunit n=1 Tax=Halalkalibacter krulwichiae TaxID=199441 RepID=A0A1X9M782_9BACI|nr:(Fe-S)-binding protein [Halalkalibacter krulwichiae]ARK29279.1 Lactate utilization protein A [Halalkalibacter krulwichiae]